MGIGLSLLANPRRGLLGRKRFDLQEVADTLLALHPMPVPLDRLSHALPPEESAIGVVL